jgi:2-polyprenyl-6-methoxyphenol hydroxylase-like FAD-dependent oxidoreductase
MDKPARAVVLGGGWSGLLAAHALSRHVPSVTVVERDLLPDGPQHRKGQPQARHVHVLWSSGVRMVEDLLPGIQDRLIASGARSIGFHSDLVTLTASGWQYRFPATQFAIMCSRPLMDAVIRDQILAAGRIEVRQGTEVVGLAGGRDRVTGAWARDVASGRRELLEADLVVDATGRASGLRRWLDAFGLPAPEEDVVDVGIGYATRVYQAPAGAEGFPAVNVAADHLSRESGRFGVVYPVEDGRWMVTLSCTRGAELPTREDEFRAFAGQLRHPIVADLIDVAEPLTPVFNSHSGVNRRLYPERLPTWPAGLVILGDSLAAFNPIYGHGMSSAARSIAALVRQLAAPGFSALSPQELQRPVSDAVDDPWIMAGLKDIAFVNCRNLSRDPRLTGPDTAARLKFSDFISHKSVRSPQVCEIVTSVLSLSAPQTAMGSPHFLSLLNTDTSYPQLTEAPFRPEELEMVGLSARGQASRGILG